MSRHFSPNPTKMARLIYFFQECVTAYKNFKQITQLFLERLVMRYFGALWAGLGIPNNTQLKLVTEILVIYSLSTLWACLGISDHTQLILHDQFVTSMYYIRTKYIYILYVKTQHNYSTLSWDIKTNLTTWLILKKSCNLIGRDDHRQ